MKNKEILMNPTAISKSLSNYKLHKFLFKMKINSFRRKLMRAGYEIQKEMENREGIQMKIKNAISHEKELLSFGANSVYGNNMVFISAESSIMNFIHNIIELIISILISSPIVIPFLLFAIWLIIFY